MVEIITANGVSLDLAPDSTFEIEIEQPLLDTEAVPVPYSTAISFLPSRKNCNEFDYIDALMLEPTNQSIQADIYVNGFKMFSGILIYDSIEDGTIQYTFAAKDSITKLESKDISENNFLGYITPRSPDGNYQQIRDNMHDKIKAPTLINKSAVMTTIQSNPKDPNLIVEVPIRYHNFPGDYDSLFTPAVRLYDFLIDEFGSGLTIDDDILQDLQKIYMICPYKPTATSAPNGFGTIIPMNETLPKINKLELFKNLAKIFGAAFYKDGEKFRLKRAGRILSSAPVVDWSDKISDEFSSRPGTPKKYILKFEDDSSDNAYNMNDLASDLEDGDILKKSSYYNIFRTNVYAGEKSYTLLHTPTGDIFSVFHVLPADIRYSDPPIMADSVLRACNNVDATESDDDTFDNSISMAVVRPVPDTIIDESGSVLDLIVAPLITPPSIGEERGSMVLIGIISDGQMTDKGFIPVPTADSDVFGVPIFQDKDLGFSLDPTRLLEKYHSEFAAWLEKRRQVVTVDLKLTTKDIASFRMYQKIYFKGREWIPLKISVSVNVASGSIDASGDFISM